LDINVAICDDERAEITYLAALVCQWAAERGIGARVAEYESAESFLFAYEADKPADILLLDIQMRGMDGVGLARRIRRDDDAMQIIFITGYPDFIAEGYDVFALHYLMKPVKSAKLFETLDKATGRIGASEPVLLFGSNGQLIRVLQKDAQYLEAVWPLVRIVTASETYEVKANLSDMEGQLDKTVFIHCHRSYVVGLRHIIRLTRTDLILDGGKTVPLSRRLYREVHQAFFNFHKRGKTCAYLHGSSTGARPRGRATSSNGTATRSRTYTGRCAVGAMVTTTISRL